MNVLYLHSHDTGRMIEPYGYAVRSPRLAEFASSAVLFRQAFTVNPTCSPSRSALLTGQHAHRCGMMGLAHRGFGLTDYSRHLAAVLRRHGYATALSGVQHETNDPNVISSLYQEVLPGGRTDGPDRDARCADAAAEYLRRKHSRPFFLSVGLWATHREFPRSADAGNYLRPFPGLPDLSAIRQDMADYQASLDLLDSAAGHVLRTLEQTGLGKDTLVICTTDHGPAFPKMKCTLRDSGLGVLLMLRIPGQHSTGKIVDAAVTHLDLFPTVMEVLGLAPEHFLDGRSLLPLIRGEAEHLHDTLFAGTNFHASYEPQRAVRTERWKYIRRYLAGPPILPNVDDSLTKQALYERGYFEPDTVEEQLYDLLMDPGEECNLISQPSLEGVLADLRSRLAEWQRVTDDPLLDGPLPCPPGAVVTTRDNYSPTGGPPPAPSIPQPSS